ncbi:endonuclease domain-containing protein [Microbacterium sp. RD1]|uniref:endonuclease domain-containing protein n=1 Tax=Microbacterium sp. RD1 TaxID=3457313 RepID=UPI003FA57888
MVASPGLDDLLARVRQGGGVVRSADLVRGGESSRRIALAVSLGLLLRLRRTWVATPDADAYLVAAAREGVVLSCVTAARRRGLWVLGEDRPHAAASAHRGHVRPDPQAVHVHRARPVLARDPAQLADSIENVLDLVARCQPHEVALAIVESALRQELVSRRSLERMPISAALRELLEAASAYSDSGLETFVLRRLRWMRARVLPQVWIAGHHVDFLIGERLVLQVDGGHHVGTQREEDIRHDAELMLLGYHVIRVGYRQLIDDWPSVQDAIVRALAQDRHLAR